jgi:hypothetical protein
MDILRAIQIPETLAVAIFSAGSVLIFIALFGKKKITIKEIRIGNVSNINRLISAFLGVFLFILSIISFIKFEQSKPICHIVKSREGWQKFNFTNEVNKIISINGSWSVDDVRYNRVGAFGHFGEDARKLEPYNNYKYDLKYPFGALLINSTSNGNEYEWIKEPKKLSQPIKEIRMRINDKDVGIGDNGGELKICFIRE